MNQDPFRYVKVEDFFAGYQSWHTLGEVVSHKYDPDRQILSVELAGGASGTCWLLVRILAKDIFRLHFNPGATVAEAYSEHNSRAVVMDTYDELRTTLAQADPYTVSVQDTPASTALTTNAGGVPVMTLTATYQPFGLSVSRPGGGSEFRVWQTSDPAFYWTRNGTDFAIIQSVLRPPTAQYVGFGEQGGRSFVKNNEQLTYFCFDNWTYNQVYNVGPLEDREPLYHADPFFMELNGVPDQDSAYGLFVDNLGQTFVDLGVSDSSRYLLGTRFGDLDYYFFLGKDSCEVLTGFISVVGRPRLKPRYSLGYHQGCYGYEDRGALEWVSSKYREYAIPFDGLHIDVDIQNAYQTFTINADRFPDASGMFTGLRAMGVKCSTNITPIISNADPEYVTYREGLQKGFFVVDNRNVGDPDARLYVGYDGGLFYTGTDPGPPASSFNTGEPYLGEVNYGGSLGTTGHYPDLARKEVRQWWGQQYADLFDAGLEMVWQDMTTPAVRQTRGDMKGFPFRLLVNADHESGADLHTTEAIKVWNLYSYNLHKATYHGLNNLPSRGDLRNFIVGRGSFTGMHRFAALWTGDNASTWDFLRINVAQVLALGMSGQAIAGEDIGGFAAGEPNQGWVGPELLMRWTMAGAFLPWFRNHYIRKGFKQFQEPFQYTEWFTTYNQPVPDPPLYAMVLPVCRYYISLRYRLLQLFYDAMFENAQSGIPICRPLCITDPGDKSLFGAKSQFLNDEFCVGPDLLVAPVLEPQTNGGGRRDVYLPAGSDWYCFMGDTQPLGPAVAGGTTVQDFDASLGLDGSHVAFLLPMYVRAGGIIPTLGVEQYVGECRDKGVANPITLTVYPGASGSYTMYLDDGISRSSAPVRPEAHGGDEKANDEYRRVLVTHGYTGPKARQVTVERVHDGYTPPLEDSFFVAVLHDPAEPKGATGPLTGVLVNGTPAPLLDPVALSGSTANAWSYDGNLNRSAVKVVDDATRIEVSLTYW